jgi:ABC-type Fe3+ transport system permease subunit
LSAATLAVVVPVSVVGVQVVGRLGTDWAARWHLAREAASLQAIVNTGVYAILIGGCSIALATPAAWLLGRTSARRRGEGTRGGPLWLALVASPLLLPSCLAYAGWGLLRGPNTHLGDWLARQDPALTVWVGKATAVFGMTLWVWPLAALVMAGSVRKLANGLPELVQMDAPSRLIRLLILARAMRGGLVSALLLVALVVIGSAIPLHVAQVPTYAIELWKVMQLSPDTTGIWVASTPLLLVAAVAACTIMHRTMQAQTTPESGVGEGTSPRWAQLGVAAVWLLSVVVPLGLFAWSLGSWRSVPMFWRISGAGVAQSLQLAAWVGGIGAAVMLATWLAIDLGGTSGRRAAGLGLGLFLFSGIAPGVLVGTAMNTVAATHSFGAIFPGASIVVLTHLARFGWVGALGGWWLASIEPREQRWIRELDAGGSLAPWIATTLRPQFAAMVGLALAIAALSFHEIESTVQVLPPGLANLPQQLLDYLHYARDEQLSAAAVNLLGIGVVFALLAAWLAAGAAWAGGGNTGVGNGGSKS